MIWLFLFVLAVGFIYGPEGWIVAFLVALPILLLWKKRGSKTRTTKPRLEPQERVRQPIPAELRWEVFRRDGFRCRYCGGDDEPLELDHIIPHSRGGQDTYDNLVAACTTCNRSKGARTPSEWARSNSYGVRLR